MDPREALRLPPKGAFPVVHGSRGWVGAHDVNGSTSCDNRRDRRCRNDDWGCFCSGLPAMAAMGLLRQRIAGGRVRTRLTPG